MSILTILGASSIAAYITSDATGYMGGSMLYWVLFIGIAIISYIVQMNLQHKFDKFSKMPLGNGMTGRDIALKMLHDNGIYDVKVISTPGRLTDHYNPRRPHSKP